MIRLRALWNVPGRADSSTGDEVADGPHRALVRSLPALRRHVLLRFLHDARGSHPAWYRGEELWVEHPEDARSLWADYRSSGLWEHVAGPRVDLWEADDVHDLQDTSPDAVTHPEPGGTVTALTGLWQVPPGSSGAEVDEVYFRHHVPGVRSLPGLARHTVLRALPFPGRRHPRFWRGAEVRFGSRAAFDRAYGGRDWAQVREDPFDAAVVGPDVDVLTIEEEWLP